MGKALAKKAGVAALETTLRAAMPELLQSLENLQGDIRQLRLAMDAQFAKVDDRFTRIDERFTKIEDRLLQVERATDQLRLEFKEELNDRAERLLAVMNELSHRITRVDQRLEDYQEFSRINSQKMDNWLERLVSVERAQQPRRRRAG